MPSPLASISQTVNSVSDATGQFLGDISSIRWASLGVGLALFGLYLIARSRATYNALRAAYPDERFQWRRIWGAYVAAYGLNGVVPAGSGSIVQLVLTRASIANSSYPTVTVALSVGIVFDTVMATLVMAYAFSQGVFPSPKEFGGLSSFDLAFIGRHPRATIFIVTALIVLSLVAIAWLSRRVRAFWVDVRQGAAILRDRRRYLIGMVMPQFAGWVLRIASYWYLLEAFGLKGSLRGALLVLAAQILAAIVPFTPGGVGVQQALLVVIFSSAASGTAVAAFSVGQQIAVTSFTLSLGFAALALIFRYRSFRAAIADARAQRASEAAPA